MKDFLFILLVHSSAFGQWNVSPSFLKERTAIPTASLFFSLQQDSLELTSGKVKTVNEEHSKSSTLAMGLSFVLPGAGQVYAERYWTIPIIWGFGYYFGRQWVKANDLYQDYQSQFANSVINDTLRHTGSSLLQQIRDFYHDERDRFGIYILLTYLLNIVDAYVGASLYAFDVSENLGGSAAIRMRIPIQ